MCVCAVYFRGMRKHSGRGAVRAGKRGGGELKGPSLGPIRAPQAGPPPIEGTELLGPLMTHGHSGHMGADAADVIRANYSRFVKRLMSVQRAGGPQSTCPCVGIVGLARSLIRVHSQAVSSCYCACSHSCLSVGSQLFEKKGFTELQSKVNPSPEIK